MIPQIADEFITNIIQEKEPDLTYRLNEEIIIGKVDKMDSIKQSIYHILSTERYSSPIYDDDYGIELEQYISKDIHFIRASIENELKEALCQDDRITDVKVNSVNEGEQKNSCVVNFSVYTQYGVLEEEINVLQ